jgi:hypothetical protein
MTQQRGKSSRMMLDKFAGRLSSDVEAFDDGGSTLLVVAWMMVRTIRRSSSSRCHYERMRTVCINMLC